MCLPDRLKEDSQLRQGFWKVRQFLTGLLFRLHRGALRTLKKVSDIPICVKTGGQLRTAMLSLSKCDCFAEEVSVGILGALHFIIDIRGGGFGCRQFRVGDLAHLPPLTPNHTPVPPPRANKHNNPVAIVNK
jgi:hypothetical protein